MPVKDTTQNRRFPADVIDELARARILGVRSGAEHAYTGVWVVVLEGRAFARSWNDKPTGWFRAFRAEPRGSLSFGDREIEVRAVPVRSKRLQEAVSAAFAEKYNTKASQKWVVGFAQPERAANTVEFVPA
jgi:hypothetical protein